MVDSALGLTIVFNGCIYNYRELRAELEAAGYAFFSRSDTEVLLKAYDRWGESFVDHLHGMFAIAIAERDSGDVLLVRDRLGIKPLYTAKIAGRLRFASSLPALVAGGGIDTSIDPIGPPPLPHLPLGRPRPPDAAQRRPAGRAGNAAADLGHRSATQTRYWRAAFRRDPAHDGMEAADWSAAILEALRVAVDRRMVADVPVGVLLSGGLDSSLIVGLLAESGQSNLSTFSVGFERVGATRRRRVRVYSDLSPTSSRPTTTGSLSPATGCVPRSTERSRAMSEPMVSHDVVAFHLLSEEVSKHVTVVQSGQGADEIFAGYDWYPPLAGRAGRAGSTSTRQVLRPHARRDRRGARAGLPRRSRRQPGLRPRAFRPPGRRHTDRPGAATRHGGDARRRPGQTRRQHDDGLRSGGAGPVPRPRARRAGRSLPDAI